MWTFADCKYITKISGFRKLKIIAYEVFFNCQALKEISGFENVTYIESGAFYGCTELIDVSFSDLLSNIDEDAFFGAPIETLNLVGKKPSGNEIDRVCGLLNKGQTGSITTFKFLLSKEVCEECGDLVTYINDVLALNKEDAALLNAVESGTLDLRGAEVEVSTLSEPGTLIDTIKQGEQVYTWSGSAWTAA
jgi:hypothetical protein